MSTVQPTDKTLVNRAGVDHSAPADMSTVQDTDLLLINRAGVDYKCTFADWKNSQSKAPDVGAVTLADVAGGARFTSVAFPVSATMTDNGIPASTKKLKAYVEGSLKTQAASPAITGVNTINTNTPALHFVPASQLTLSFTPAATGSHTTFTFSCWLKAMAQTPASIQRIFYARTGTSDKQTFIQIRPDGQIWIAGDSEIYSVKAAIPAGFTSWHHYVFSVDTTNATPADRIRIFIDGVRVTTNGAQPSLNYATAMGTPINHCIGGDIGTSGEYFDGFLAEVHSVNGLALDPSSFTVGTGAAIKSIPYVGPHGPIGFYLDFAGAAVADFGKDAAGANNLNASSQFNTGHRVLTGPATQKTELLFGGNAGLADFKRGDALTEAGGGNDGRGEMAADYAPADGNKLTIYPTAGTWDVGSAVKGPLKAPTITLKTSAITKVEQIDIAAGFTHDSSMQLINRVQNGVTYTATPGGMFDGDSTTGFGAYNGAWVITFNPPIKGTVFTLKSKGADLGARIKVNGTEVSLPNHNGDLLGVTDTDISGPAAGSLSTISQANYGSNWARFIDVYVDGRAINTKFTRLTLTDTTNLSSFAAGDAVTEAGGGNNGLGTIQDIDAVGKTIDLVGFQPNWDVGSAVEGPPKSSGASVKLYCKLNAAGAVSDLQSADPGFTAWTPAGTGPYTGKVTFPATLPTGNAPDTDLPAGTTITVEVEASNTSGSDSAKSNVLTPA